MGDKATPAVTPAVTSVKCEGCAERDKKMTVCAEAVLAAQAAIYALRANMLADKHHGPVAALRMIEVALEPAAVILQSYVPAGPTKT